MITKEEMIHRDYIYIGAIKMALEESLSIAREAKDDAAAEIFATMLQSLNTFTQKIFECMSKNYFRSAILHVDAEKKGITFAVSYEKHNKEKAKHAADDLVALLETLETKDNWQLLQLFEYTIKGAETPSVIVFDANLEGH